MSVTHQGAPTFEIKGDPAAIRGRIAVMRDRASDFERIAWSLQEISVSGWSGRAAERFHEHFKLQPENGGVPQRLSAVPQMPGKSMRRRSSKLKRVLLKLKSRMKRESLPSKRLSRNGSGQTSTRRPIYLDCL